MKPCVPRKGVYYDEDEFVAHNSGLVKRFGEEWTRNEWRGHLERAEIPAKCPTCGFHHKPAASSNSA
jgi:hypothetical protein